MSQIHTRGAWNPIPQHHMVFTFQATPADASAGRKRMRYLKETTRPGDTFFNEWPVPMHQLSQMARITPAEHEAIFSLDTPMDEGGDDGAGAAMVNDLGDKVVPFPREFHVKLWQEMIHVWGIEAAVLFTVGGGQALLAFILERKRAVGIVKNPRHKDVVTKNLVQAVKTLGLAPDRRPAKPADIVAWEQSRNVGGKPPAVGVASTSFSSAAAPSVPVVAGTTSGPPSAPPAPLVAGRTSAPPAPAQAEPASCRSAAAGPLMAAFGQSTLR